MGLLCGFPGPKAFASDFDLLVLMARLGLLGFVVTTEQKHDPVAISVAEDTQQDLLRSTALVHGIFSNPREQCCGVLADA